MELNNKRIAKNTIFLYLRMLLSLVVSLYTSRVVLQVLGADDYGTYTVVGGIVEEVYWCTFVAMSLIFITDSIILKRDIPGFPLSAFFIEAFGKTIPVVIAVGLGLYLISLRCPSGFSQLTLSVALSIFCGRAQGPTLHCNSSTYFFAFDSATRYMINEKIKA